MKLFSEEHLWVEMVDEVATVGITAHASSELGEIHFVELPSVDAVLAQGDVLCVIESTKIAQDVVVPVGGTVCAVNLELEDKPGLLENSPERDGWICRLQEVEDAELESLMDEDTYELFVGAAADSQDS